MMDERGKLQDDLAKLKAKKEVISRKILALRKKFEIELHYGSPKGAEECRTEISHLEKENRGLSMEIERLEKEGGERDGRKS